MLFPSEWLQARLSSSDTAGVEQKRFETQTEFDKKARSVKKKVSEPIVLPPEQKSVEPAREGPFFLIREVKLTGNESIPEKKIRPLFDSILNQEVSLQRLREKALVIKQYYRQHGFIASYVYVPPQKIQNGVVEFRVVEGTLGQLTVKNNHWFSEKILRRQIHIRAGKILRFDKLRQDMDRLNRHQDIQARAVVKEGAEPKTTDLDIEIKDHFPWHVGADVSNRGTPNTGTTRTGISLTHTNLFGLMGDASGRFQIGKSVWGVGANAGMPLTSSGANLALSYLRSSVNVGGDFRSLNIKGEATTYGFAITHPLFTGNQFESHAGLGFDWKSVENRILGSVSGKDEFRILHPDFDFSLNDPWGSNQTTHSFNFGFDRFLGASNKNDSRATRLNSGGQFFIYRATYSRSQPLPAGLSASFRSSIQLTPDRLAPSEQLNLGGALSIRGYPESEFLADSGGMINTEFLVPAYFFPKDWKLPYAVENLRDQIQGVTFFDFGGGINHRALVGETRSKTLASVGLGVRVRLANHLIARFEWGMPTGADPNNGSHSAYHFGVSSEV